MNADTVGAAGAGPESAGVCAGVAMRAAAGLAVTDPDCFEVTVTGWVLAATDATGTADATGADAVAASGTVCVACLAAVRCELFTAVAAGLCVGSAATGAVVGSVGAVSPVAGDGSVLAPEPDVAATEVDAALDVGVDGGAALADSAVDEPFVVVAAWRPDGPVVVAAVVPDDDAPVVFDFVADVVDEAAPPDEAVVDVS